MRTLCRVLVITCLLVPLVHAQRAAPDAAAAALSSAREALGGDAKLSAVKTVVATGRTRQIRGDNLVPIEFEIAIDLPDKYVRKDEIPAQEAEPSTVGFNGNTLIQFPIPTPPPARAGGPPPPTADQMEAARTTRLANVRQDFARLTLGMFASSFSSVPLTFTYAGKAEAPQGRADVLEVNGPIGSAARLFINADTHLPIMISWQAPAPPQRGRGPMTGPGRAGGAPPAGGPPPGSSPPPPGAPPPSRGDAPAGAPTAAPPESRLYYGDYRDVNGMQFPFRLRRALGPDTIEETTFDGFKINAKIDPKKFEVRK